MTRFARQGRRRRPRWAVAAATAATAALLLAGCGGGGDDDRAAQTVTVDWGEPENPLIPGVTTEQQGGDAIDQLFTGLVRYDPETAAPANANAESITTTDNTTFTVRLKPGWTFHDGTPVTAQSYVDAWNWTAYGPNAAQSSTFMEKIVGYDQVASEQPAAPTMSGLRVVDPQTFTVTLKAAFAIFPTTLGYTAYYPLPQKFFADRAGYEAAPVGDGPFRFESRTPNQNLVLDRYDQYAGDDKAQVQRLEFRVYDSQQTAYDDLVSGNLDHLKAIPTSALANDKWKTDLGAGAKQKEGLSITTLGFPLYDQRFANPLVRKAFSMAIDRQALVAQVSGGLWRAADGLATPAAQGFVPNQCGEACTFDPVMAKQLLAQAGGFQGPLTLTANADGGHDEWMQAVTNNLRQNLGIDAQYAPLPSFAEIRRTANAKQYTGLFRAAWIGDYPNLETFLTQLYRTGASSNDFGYSNPAVDAALDQADRATSIPAAEAGYAQAERLVLNDMPAIPIYSRPIAYGDGRRLTAGERSPLDRLDGSTFALAPQGS